MGEAHQMSLRLSAKAVKKADQLAKKLRNDPRLVRRTGRAPNKSDVLRLAIALGLEQLQNGDDADG